mmetsp:Transcript_48591/g.141519  ORF Transcript_48591/g.141519 Transcript_48591/m.141519 type:complete len:277 (-) Transcript_48591:1062-1892(-)
MCNGRQPTGRRKRQHGSHKRLSNKCCTKRRRLKRHAKQRVPCKILIATRSAPAARHTLASSSAAAERTSSPTSGKRCGNIGGGKGRSSKSACPQLMISTETSAREFVMSKGSECQSSSGGPQARRSGSAACSSTLRMAGDHPSVVQKVTGSHSGPSDTGPLRMEASPPPPSPWRCSWRAEAREGWLLAESGAQPDERPLCSRAADVGPQWATRMSSKTRRTTSRSPRATAKWSNETRMSGPVHWFGASSGTVGGQPRMNACPGKSAIFKRTRGSAP